MLGASVEGKRIIHFHMHRLDHINTILRLTKVVGVGALNRRDDQEQLERSAAIPPTAYSRSFSLLRSNTRTPSTQVSSTFV